MRPLFLPGPQAHPRLRREKQPRFGLLRPTPFACAKNNKAGRVAPPASCRMPGGRCRPIADCFPYPPYFTVRIAAGPACRETRCFVSTSLSPAILSTCNSFCSLFCTSSVLLSAEKATPWVQTPLDTWEV